MFNLETGYLPLVFKVGIERRKFINTGWECKKKKIHIESRERHSKSNWRKINQKIIKPKLIPLLWPPYFIYSVNLGRYPCYEETAGTTSTV